MTTRATTKAMRDVWGEMVQQEKESSALLANHLAELEMGAVSARKKYNIDHEYALVLTRDILVDCAAHAIAAIELIDKKG